MELIIKEYDKTNFNKYLARSLAPVTSYGPKVQHLFDKMLDVMYKNKGIGIAANQVGLDIRLAIVQLHPAGEIYEMCNPKIILRGSHKKVVKEGCLSLLYGDFLVERYETVAVKYKTPYGKPKTVLATGLLAYAMQHEIDHLNLKECIDGYIVYARTDRSNSRYWSYGHIRISSDKNKNVVNTYNIVKCRTYGVELAFRILWHMSIPIFLCVIFVNRFI